MKNEGESLYWKIVNSPGELLESLKDNPANAILVAIALVLVFLLGLILDWNWTLYPTGSSDMINKWIEIFGRKTVRLVYGIIVVILLIALGYMYYHYTFK